MIFLETPVQGVRIVEIEPLEDERGFFARTFAAAAFAEQGLDPRTAECSTSFNARAGTLRGMHYVASPHEEAKLVRCTCGAVYDVALDLRPTSPSYLRWHATELSAKNRRALYIPPGCAHGFQTLCDDTEVLYQMSVPYEPDAARGVRWDDPAFAIEWPDAPPEGRTISQRDRDYPDSLL